MKKTVLIGSVLLLFCLLPACGKTERSAEPTSSFEQSVDIKDTQISAEKAAYDRKHTTVPPEPVTEKKHTANKTYGKSKSTVETVHVLDTAVDARTEDSYSFETQAVEAAKNALRKTLYDPKTLDVLAANVWNCVDDGENVYYSVHLDVSYQVESGDFIQRGFFYDAGVNKKNGKAFEAADVIDEVSVKYSIYKESTSDKTAAPQDGTEAERYENAAKVLAERHIKHPDSAKFLSVTPLEPIGEYRQFDVEYEAVNDYGMRVACLYTITLTEQDGAICEVDPTEL